LITELYLFIRELYRNNVIKFTESTFFLDIHNAYVLIIIIYAATLLYSP